MSFLSTAFSGASNNFAPQGKQESLTQYTNAGNGLNELALALKQQMNGGGPNLANQQLQNTTGQNVSNQAALQAGQRGASSNVGLMSRQIAQQGGQLQQQAAGQAASNRLAQQLGAQSQLGGVLSSEGQLGASVLNNSNNIGSQQGQQNAKMNQDLISGISGGLSGGMFKFSAGGLPEQSPQMSHGFLSNFLSGNRPEMPVQMMAQGGANRLPFAPITDYRQGGQVQAQNLSQKAVKPGNDYANDKIPAMMSEGEVVLPREVTQSPNAPQMAAHFMQQVMQGKHRVKK